MRLIAQRTSRVKVAHVEAPEQMVQVVRRHRTAVQALQILQVVGGAQIAIDRQLAWQVADLETRLEAVAMAIDAEH